MNSDAALLTLSGLFLSTAAALAITTIHLRRLKHSLHAKPETVPQTTLPPAATIGSQFAISELQAVFDSITDYICIIDKDYTVCQSNKSYCTAAGKPLSEVIGRKCYEVLWNRSTPCEECPLQLTFSNGVPVLRKKMVLRRSDEQKHIEISTYPILDEHKKVVHVIEYVRDMTEEAHMLDQLIRSEKLASIGVMTTGIAHEMNNALSGIAGTASNLLTMPEKFGLNEKAVNRIFSILDAATRATSVMKNLLQFSTPLQEETRVMVNLKQLIKKIITTVYIQEAPDVERRLNFDDTLPPIRADISKVELVLMNVISNAIRSVQEKKNRLAKEDKPFKGSLIVSARPQNDTVLITVTDNGVGIPEEIRAKIFDPFFSTWPHGKGTGLGLSTALHIVEEHGGRIFFESVDDLTTFSVQFPIERKGPSSVVPLSAGQ